MLTIQPPIIGKYFSTRTSRHVGSIVHRGFYLSWEDALWHLCKSRNIQPGAAVMVPEFFCGNVIEHMKDHGLHIFSYPVSRRLITPQGKFASMIKRINPDILIIFHAVGVTNDLVRNYKKWLPLLSRKAILLEDFVHRIIVAEELKFLKNNHIFIDSLRKVVPIQGSQLYTQRELPPIGVFQSIITFPYRLRVLRWWLIMQLNLVRAYNSSNAAKRNMCNKLAEEAMINGYEVIGTNILASPGFKFMDMLSSMLTIQNIEEVKIRQVGEYKSVIKLLVDSNNFWIPKIRKVDFKNLRGFPLIIQLSIAERFLKYLRNSGIYARFELNDSDWSKRQKIIYLPMGIHVSLTDIRAISQTLKNFLD